MRVLFLDSSPYAPANIMPNWTSFPVRSHPLCSESCLLTNSLQMGAKSSTVSHRFSVDHSRVHMPTLVPVVPKSLPPIYGSDGISYVCPRSYVHSMEPVPEVSIPRAPPPRGYSGMETSYDAPCDEYIADIELKRKKPVGLITGKPQSWFSFTKSKFLGKADSSQTPLLLGKQPSRTRHTVKSDEIVLRPSAQVTESWC